MSRGVPLSSETVFENEEELQRANLCFDQVSRLIAQDGKLEIPKDEYFLLRFIRAKKYDPDLTYKSLKQYYGARLKYPQSFKKFYPSALKHVLDARIVTLLKHSDSLGRRIFVFQMKNWEPTSGLNFDDITMTCVLVAEEMSRSLVSHLRGAVILVDEKGINLSHAKHLTLPALHKMASLLQDCFPGRYKAMHMVNQPYVFDILYNLGKRFLSKKLASRIRLHSGYDSVGEFIPKEILPQSLGGYLDENEAWDEDLFKQMFIKDKAYKDLLEYGFK